MGQLIWVKKVFLVINNSQMKKVEITLNIVTVGILILFTFYFSVIDERAHDASERFTSNYHSIAVYTAYNDLPEHLQIEMESVNGDLASLQKVSNDIYFYSVVISFILSLVIMYRIVKACFS